MVCPSDFFVLFFKVGLSCSKTNNNKKLYWIGSLEMLLLNHIPELRPNAAERSPLWYRILTAKIRCHN